MRPLDAWIEIKQLKFNRGRRVILDDINLCFYPGRHYIIAGPNGAGKSTFLDILSGLIKNFSGNISVLGRKLNGWKKIDLARKMALAPQDYRLDFPFTVEEMVSFGRRPYLNRFGYLTLKDKKIIEDSLIALDLNDLASKKIINLSGGEKQRAVLARALAQQADILLLDEPTAGLDIAHALKLMKLATTKANSGHLVITVTHDLALAATYGQEFIFLKNGRLMAAGAASEVLTCDTLGKVYEVESMVSESQFTGGKVIQFK